MEGVKDVKNEDLRRIKLKLKDLISKQLDVGDYTPINPHEIRNYIYYGFSDEKLRPRYWKLLLNYYTPNKFKMELFYRQARQSYNDILTKSCKDTGARSVIKTISAELERTSLTPTEKTSIERILTAFAFTNPGVGYVQGMITLVRIFYTVLTGDEDLESSKFAEEDAFYLFNNLISELSNLFMGEYDDQRDGIKHKVNQVFEIVKEKDPELYDVLIEKDLIKTMFPLKWIMFIFSTEYELEQVFWLWDKIFSDAYRFEMLLYCSAAIIILLRQSIMTEGYDKCLIILQDPFVIAPELVFKIADSMRRSERDINEVIKEKIDKKS
ncbi:hypothetical protein GINT2_000113 [Glugoides intestinalis]